MTNARPKSILLISSLLIVLAALSLISLVTSQISRARFPGDPPGNFPAEGNFQRPNNNGGNFQGGDGNFQPRNGGGFNPFGTARSLGIGGQVFGYIGTGFSILMIVGALASAYGVWKQKRWALNLAIVVGILLLVGALPGLFFGGRIFNFWRTAQNMVTLAASVVIAFTAILPSVRDSVS